MSALLLALLLQAAPSHPAPSATPATSHAQPAEAPAAGAHETATEAHPPAAEGQAAEGGESGHEASPADVIMHHAMDGPIGIFPSKHMLFLFLVAVLVIVIAQLAVRSYRGGRIPRGVGAAVESLVVFIRDEVAEPNIGHGDGRRFTPLLCSFFFFILASALVGLLPFSATSTGNIAVTLALASVSFAAQQWAGISK